MFRKPSLTAVLTVVTTVATASFAMTAARAADESLEKVVVRETAHFDFDKARLRPQDQAAILAKVGKMKGVTWQTVTATGHTDSIGPATYNEKLATERASSVKSYLVGNGLDPKMIDTAARAAAMPLADNRSASGRARNRRVEVEFQGVRAAESAQATQATSSTR